MSYATQAAQYREMEVMTASPAKLIVILFDQALVSLRQARLAIENGNTETRLRMIHKARNLVTELFAVLDHKKGGEIAPNLAAIYALVLSELVTLGVRAEVERVDRMVEILTPIRDAYAILAGEDPEG